MPSFFHKAFIGTSSFNTNGTFGKKGVVSACGKSADRRYGPTKLVTSWHFVFSSYGYRNGFQRSTENRTIVHSKKISLHNHNLSVDTSADRCTTLIWCSRPDQRRRRRCLAPKISSCRDTGCCSQPLRLNTAVCGRSKYFFLVAEHFQASWLLFFRVR